jgi:hypothetical protein
MRRFEILEAVWGRNVKVEFGFEKLTLEDVGITLPQKVTIQLSSDTASYPTRK